MTKLEIFDDVVDIMKKDSSSGDAFVETMMMSPKVTVGGCPATGICDYSNCNFVNYRAYKFVYPTSRFLAIDKGKLMAKNGVPVDIYIP